MIQLDLYGTRGTLLRQLLEIDPKLETVLWKVRLLSGSIALWQQAVLAHLASQYDREDAVLLNIGAKYGLSTACLCLGAPKAFVHTLEPEVKRVGIAARHLARYNAQVHAEKSWDFLEKMPKLKVDMVFLDGCHREVERDMPWFDRLKPGGLFLSHDYAAWKFPYVVEALEKLKKRQGKAAFDVLILDEREAGIAGLYKR